MGWTSDLARGFAELLDGEGVGVYSPDAPIPPGAVAIALTVEPTWVDRAVTLTPYTVEDALTGATVQGLQAICRGEPGDPFGADDLADAVYQVLHGRHRFTVGGVRVQNMWRQSYAQLGRDDNDRQRSSSNFHMNLSHHTPHTTDR